MSSVQCSHVQAHAGESKRQHASSQSTWRRTVKRPLEPLSDNMVLMRNAPVVTKRKKKKKKTPHSSTHTQQTHPVRVPPIDSLLHFNEFLFAPVVELNNKLGANGINSPSSRN